MHLAPGGCERAHFDSEPVESGNFGVHKTTSYHPKGNGNDGLGGFRDTCRSCEAGEFQDRLGATACKTCSEGSFCPSGASAELPVPAAKLVAR